MKKLLFCFAVIVPFFGKAQSVTADPALEPMKITSVSNNPIDYAELPLNGVIRLKVPILNKNLTNGLPVGSCKVKIGLGSKLILDPSFNLSTVNTSNYFEWTALSSGGEVKITGELIAPLPENYSDTAYFDVKGSILGISTISTNFLVTNHNTTVNLSDENGTNNLAFVGYRIVSSILPVTFTNIIAENKNCSLNVIFDIENQINVDKYELEVSKDFNSFEKVSSLNAGNVNQYSFNFNISEKFQVDKLLVRVKSLDVDGKTKHSDIKIVTGICGSKAALNVYPNPVPHNTNVVYVSKGKGLFNGTYTLLIVDMVGKNVQTTNLKLVNTTRLNINTEGLTAGHYIIKLIKLEDNSQENLKLIKL